LEGLNRVHDFHKIGEWAFLTDDPRLIAQRLWLLAKPALAQPTSALVEFLARRTLAEVLKEKTPWLTKKVNEVMPDGSVSEELIGRWLRDAFTDSPVPSRLIPTDATPLPSPASTPPAVTATTQAPPAQRESSPELSEPVSKRIGMNDLVNAKLLLPQDVLMVEGADGKRQTASISPDGKINVAGQIFDSVSPAALRALELAGRVRKTVNGWAAFRVQRGGNYIGTLLEIRGQYEDREQGAPTVGSQQDDGLAAPEGPDAGVLNALEQMKPLLALLPELIVKTSKATISLYAGKLVVAYAYPRKTGVPRLRAYVGETCPDWVTADTTYASWCNIDDWNTNLERVVALINEAPQHRNDDMTAGRDAYRRRSHPSSPSVTHTPD
jgi:hypothetical protein